MEQIWQSDLQEPPRFAIKESAAHCFADIPLVQRDLSCSHLSSSFVQACKCYPAKKAGGAGQRCAKAVLSMPESNLIVNLSHGFADVSGAGDGQLPFLQTS